MVNPLYRRASLAVGIPLGIWIMFLLFTIIPAFQRHVLYMHRIYPFWLNADEPQQWGFAKNQVTPFSLTTEDGQSIYAWHVLPLPIYREHEQALRAEPTGFRTDVSATESFRILKDDPEAKLILYFHGNAGSLPNFIRAPSFHVLTDTSRYHVIAIDYRGFGQSSGSPTEEGLIKDASALVDFALKTANIAPNRVVLMGHSLGTAVTAAVAEKYARLHSVDFAGLILVSGFSSLPTMLAGYSIGGFIPIMKPLRPWPHLLDWVMRFIVDRWPTADRLRALVENVKNDSNSKRRLNLSLVHAADDNDIPAYEDDKLFTAAVSPFLTSNASSKEVETAKEARTQQLGENAYIALWQEGRVTVRQELFPCGGHNHIIKHAAIPLEVMRLFEEAQ